MSAERVAAALVAAGDRVAVAAVAARVRAVAAVAERAELPGVRIAIAADGVELRGRGLVVRAFGGRRGGADPAVAAMLADVRDGGG